MPSYFPRFVDAIRGLDAFMTEVESRYAFMVTDRALHFPSPPVYHPGVDAGIVRNFVFRAVKAGETRLDYYVSITGRDSLNPRNWFPINWDLKDYAYRQTPNLRAKKTVRSRTAFR